MEERKEGGRERRERGRGGEVRGTGRRNGREKSNRE